MAKPVVDGLEQDLVGQADMLRINGISQVGRMLAARYGVPGFPTTLVFDGAGQVVYAQAGIPDGESIQRMVSQVLAD